MAVVSKGNTPLIVDLKSATLTLVAVVLKTTDLAALAGELGERFGANADFFNQDPVVIDLGPVQDDAKPIAFAHLIALLREHSMVPVAVKGGSPAQMAAAQAVGLFEAPDGPSAKVPVRVETVVQEVVREVEVIREVPVQVPGPSVPTMVIHKPLRSGQQVYAKGGDLVVLAAVNNGAEVLADGHIHVYAPLRGKAIAGARGNLEARIFTTCLEPELISIAGTYRTSETPLSPDVLGKPAQVRLDGDKLVIEAIKLN
ncbi:septum site-determining protein MinC [Aquabacterium sp.]|uniref:septum site-determining protein MinC n=1 Tax=Aquabacterium sp. TaxID=1872578 RepID=UPI003D6D3392